MTRYMREKAKKGTPWEIDRVRIARSWYHKAAKQLHDADHDDQQALQGIQFNLEYSRAILASFIIELLTGYATPYGIIIEQMGEKP